MGYTSLLTRRYIIREVVWMLEVLPTIALWLLYGVAGMFFTLAAIISAGAIIYPFYMIWKGIKENLL